MSNSSFASLSKAKEKILTALSCIALLTLWVGPISAEGHHAPASTPAGQSSLSSSFAAQNVMAYDLQTTATLATATFEDATSFPITVANVGTFSAVNASIRSDDYYSAGTGTGKYILAQDMTLELATTSDYRYVGFYWSGGNAENHVQLLDASNVVLAEFSADIPNSTEDLRGRTGSCTNNTSDYCGSPNAETRGSFNNDQDRFAFIHLRYEPGFRKIRFYGFNFEVDNVTVSQTVPTVGQTETTTEVLNPFTLSTPTVLIADPRTSSVAFPGVTLGAGSGETNAMLCFAEVQADGAALASSQVLSFMGSGTGITGTTGTNLWTFRGARDDVTSFSPNIDIISPDGVQRFSIVGSRYFRVTATPQISAGSAGCTGSATVSTVVEVRFLQPQRSNSFGITIR